MEFSVLMSVYFKEKPEYLSACFESLMSQTIPVNEIVLVCDGPLNDELNEVIHSFKSFYENRLIVVRLEKNMGLGNALNVGLKHCSHELIARMDTDDIAINNRFGKQLEVMQNGDIDITSGSIIEFDGDISNIVSRRSLPITNEEIFEFAKKRNPFNHPAVMFKKSVVQSVGGYEDYHLFEDYQLWVKVLNNGAKGYNISDDILYMRVGDGMYKRRGGCRYVKSVFKIEKYKRSIGFTTFSQYLSCVIVKSISSIIPSKLREIIYKKILRH